MTSEDWCSATSNIGRETCESHCCCVRLLADNMHFAVILTIIVLSALPAAAAQAGTPVTLPVEVVGENGTTSSVTVEIPTPLARQVRSLWIEIHGLSYAGMVRVEINEGSWV